MIKKSAKLLVLCLVGISGILAIKTPTLLFAQTETATESNSFDPAVVKELGDRVKKVVDEKRGQIEGVIEELSQKKRGFIGQVQRLTEESITVVNQEGTEVISLNSDVDFLKNGREIDIEDIAVEDWLVVMGLIEDESFSAKRILVSSESLRPRKHLVRLGTIINQSTQELQLLSRKEEELTFQIGSQTEFQNQNGEIVEPTELIDDLQVLVVGYEADDEKNATIIRALAPLEELKANDQSS